MSIIAERLSVVKPSATVVITQKARELLAAGVDVISLSAGEPDFDTPSHIIEAAKKALDDGMTRYTPVNGIPALQEAIALKFKRDNDLDYKPSEIHVSAGGKPVIFNAMMATVNAGDEIIVPAPYWVSFGDIPRLFGGKCTFVASSEDNGFKITPAQLEQAITPRTKWLILNSPSNPTGAGYTRDDLKGLAEVLRRHPQVWTLTDDMYEHIVYDGFEFTTLAQVAPDLKERTVTLNGVSKAYCMTGWRIGFAGAPEELVKAMSNVQSQSLTCTTTVSQVASVVALTGPQDIITEHNRIFQERRDLVISMLNQASGLTCFNPQGAFYAYPSVAGVLGKKTPNGKTIETDADFVTELLECEAVAAVPGSAFGLAPYFRISYATSTDVLEEACTRIQRFCASLT